MISHQIIYINVPISDKDKCLCFQEKQRFLTDVLHEVMLLDGLNSSHPISQEVEQATDIDRVFDWIAYKKVCVWLPQKNDLIIDVFMEQIILKQGRAI